MLDSLAREDPFTVLGVKRTASYAQLTTAYDALIVKHPPHTDPDGFARIHGAFLRAAGIDTPGPMPPPQPVMGGDGPYEQMVAALDRDEHSKLATIVTNASRSAIDDAAMCEACLRGASVLAWTWADWDNQLGALIAHARTLKLSHAAEVARYELELAQRYRDAARSDPFLDKLRSLFGDILLASPTRRRSTTRELKPFVDDPQRLLAACDGLALRDIGLVRSLAHRLQRESPDWSDRALAPLPADIRAELEKRLAAVGVARALRLGMGITGAVAGVGLTAVGFPFGFHIAMVSAALGINKPSYRKKVRPQLVPIVASLGVQSDTIVAWQRANPKRGKQLASYAVWIQNDAGLVLFGAIAAIVHEHERDVSGEPTSVYR